MKQLVVLVMLLTAILGTLPVFISDRYWGRFPFS